MPDQWGTVDETDFRILGHLFVKPLDGPQAIARKVGLTRNAVARRIRNLEQSPLNLRFFALPHQSLFKAVSTVNLYAGIDHPDLRAIESLAGAIGWDINHDGLCAVTLWQATPAPA